jgi:hypothetical protein
MKDLSRWKLVSTGRFKKGDILIYRTTLDVDVAENDIGNIKDYPKVKVYRKDHTPTLEKMREFVVKNREEKFKDFNFAKGWEELYDILEEYLEELDDKE